MATPRQEVTGLHARGGAADRKATGEASGMGTHDNIPRSGGRHG
jgi:hypothetical protein